MSASAIIAFGCGDFDELLRDIDDIDREICAFDEVVNEIASACNNHARALLETEVLAVSFESAEAVVAVGVTQVSGEFRLADSSESVVDDDVLL